MSSSRPGKTNEHEGKGVLCMSIKGYAACACLWCCMVLYSEDDSSLLVRFIPPSQILV